MKRVLFVTNGHGEISIAERIARELPAEIAADHLALVGAHSGEAAAMRDVGPRRALPSGGLIAMGNVRNIVRDIAGGLIGHTFEQLRFLRRSRGAYDVAVAVGDVFALLMAQRARAAATVYVGTAKSVYVAPYGPMEERVIRAVDSAFVRDAATAQRLRDHGINARAANVIVDLYAPHDGELLREGFSPYLALFPGSREEAYADAVEICRVVREMRRMLPRLGAALSIAPALSNAKMARAFATDGWDVRASEDPQRPFSLLHDGEETVRAWRGPLGAMLPDAAAVLGQAGTANEAAASWGIPIVALERGGKRAWYRRRQIGLLGDALAIVSGPADRAARTIASLLDDQNRLARMRATGRERMGPAGGALAVAAEIVHLCA
jgi:uncharacterized protein (TIGR03492 family)